LLRGATSRNNETWHGVFARIAGILFIAVALSGCGNVDHSTAPYDISPSNYYQTTTTQPTSVHPEPEKKHAILHLTHHEFINSINNPRIFPTLQNEKIFAGVVPHHNTAAVLISGFFAQASNHVDDYDLVIILAPNHEGELASVVLSYRDWDIGNGVFTCRQFVNDLMDAEGINTAIGHSLMELDHAASILIPYIYHYLPDTKVAPILLNRTLSFDATIQLFYWINTWVASSDKNILLVASIDFSHFLTVPQSREMDRVTKEAIFSHDLHRIHAMNYHYLDSTAAMIIFLMYLEYLGLPPQIVAHTDASEFLGPGLDETTSYMIIVGTKPSDTAVLDPARKAQEAEGRVQLTFTGDIMLHQAQMNASADFDRSFSAVRPLLQDADLAIGNLETVLAGFFMDDNSTPFPRFSAPDEFGYALKNAGFNLLSTANNHALDQGVEGLLRNINFLETLGIDSFGTYPTAEARDNILIREVHGMRFAFLSYTFGTNNQPIPPGREYLVNIINENLIRADITRARALADFVIIMPHMGYEYELTVRDSIKSWAMMMLEAGADIVVAGHPHVVQPMGFVDVIDPQTGLTRRGFVAYCLGNFISSQRMPHTYTGIILNLYFEMAANSQPVLAEYSYVPTRVAFEGSNAVVLPELE